jgi:phenylpropionate dioxygenase-like ring-hydroxylating dioxygenase large terminal subunit
MYLKNAWYVAAWGSEITDVPLGRMLLNEPIVFFRGTDGAVAALEDRCCHRGMPLSHGSVQGGGIRCEYHGMVFDGQGLCTDIPGQSAIPRNARVRSYPVAERDRIVWIWMGEPELADAQAIVSYPWHDRWPHKTKTEILAGNYLLFSDNLLDQTHAAFVHKSTLASDPAAYVRTEMNVEATPDGVKFTRWMLDCEPPGIYARAVEFKGRVDRWQEFEYVAPSCILQFTGAMNVGEGAYEDPARDKGFGLRMFYGITPETEDRSWFIWSAANGHCQDDPAATDQLFHELERAFKEDEDVIAAQHETLRRMGDRPYVNIASDGARVQARRALERKIASERGIAPEEVVTLV